MCFFVQIEVVMKRKYTATEWIALVCLIPGSVNSCITLGFAKGFGFFLCGSFVLFVFWCVCQIWHNRGIKGFYRKYIKRPE
jgi:hypothetical protein